MDKIPVRFRFRMDARYNRDLMGIEVMGSLSFGSKTFGTMTRIDNEYTPDAKESLGKEYEWIKTEFQDVLVHRMMRHLGAI